MQPAGEGPKVYWYGPVDKIGSNLAALPRVLFITPNAVLICQPTGGVTRTVFVEKLAEVVLAPPTVVRLIVAQEPDLVISTQTPTDRSELMNSLLRAFRETCGEGSELPITESQHLVLPSASPSPISFTSSHPPTPTQGHTRNVWDGSDSIPLRQSPQTQKDSQGGSIRGIMGQLEEEKVASSTEAYPVSTFLDGVSSRRKPQQGTGALPTQHSPGSPSRIEWAYEPQQPTQSSLASLQQQIESQKRIIERLQHDHVNDAASGGLRRELEQARALISDLQVALRSQEGAFSEMVKSSEALKTSETIRSSQDAQIHALREELQSVKANLVRRDAGDEEWRKKIVSLEEGHRNELQAVRDAFAKYDEQVTTYVEQMKKEHDVTLRELLQQKDSLLVKQGELISRVDQLESEKRATQQQRNLLTGGVWRPQSPGPSASLNHSSHDISSDELRSALLAKLNRYTNSNPVPLGVGSAGGGLYNPAFSGQRDVADEPRGRTPNQRKHNSPQLGRARDRSIL
ncbi:Hypothetical protein, putative [Bodo saltans]|uniref:Uncharacterized protein n=1 Tax=Bodo saltans TaxID=75058 RepID=A0A0S4J252_BODSA|nr:Hypothetical protein, putative [Bodo saltans]|eukprot:CUG17905.1 Hypothetical protein, putative [Bodo saltans]